MSPVVLNYKIKSKQITTEHNIIQYSYNYKFRLYSFNIRLIFSLSPTYPPTYLPTYLPTYPTYLPTYIPIYIPTYLHTYLPTYLPTCPLTHLPTYLPTHQLPIYPPTHLPTYPHTHLPIILHSTTRILILTAVKTTNLRVFRISQRYNYGLRSPEIYRRITVLLVPDVSTIPSYFIFKSRNVHVILYERMDHYGDAGHILEETKIRRLLYTRLIISIRVNFPSSSVWV